MNFLKLKYFLVAAEELSFSKAAEKLFVSPQALSKHISQIESYYGVTLFKRKPGLSLTPEGKCLQQKARKILALEQEFMQEIKTEHSGFAGIIRIGYSHNGTLKLLKETLSDFHQNNPQVQFELLQGSTGQISEWLSQGKIDFFIAPDVFLSMDLSVITLTKERICLVWSDDCGIDVPPKLPPDMPLLLPSESHYIRRAVDRYLLKIHHPTHILAECSDFYSLLEMCRAHMGITFCPESLLSESSCSEGLSYAVITDPAAQYQYQLCYLSSYSPEPQVLAFINLLKKYNKAEKHAW